MVACELNTTTRPSVEILGLKDALLPLAPLAELARLTSVSVLAVISRT